MLDLLSELLLLSFTLQLQSPLLTYFSESTFLQGVPCHPAMFPLSLSYVPLTPHPHFH